MDKYERPKIKNFIYTVKDLRNADWIEHCDGKVVLDPKPAIGIGLAKEIGKTIKEIVLKATIKIRKEFFGGLVLDSENLHLFEVNQTGYELLKNFRGQFDEIVERFSQKHELDEKTARKAIEDFVKQCYQLGLITTPV